MEITARYQGPSTFGDILSNYLGDVKTSQHIVNLILSSSFMLVEVISLKM